MDETIGTDPQGNAFQCRRWRSRAPSSRPADPGWPASGSWPSSPVNFAARI